MSKQSEAKQRQGYRTEGPRCGNCYLFVSDSVPIQWMVDANLSLVEKGMKPYYDLTLDENKKESNMRCQIGEFAVKKMAYCNQWRDANE